jgi:AraC-like DNA-binding protein
MKICSDHQFPVQLPYYSFSFKRLRDLAAELRQEKTVAPFLVNSDSLSNQQAFNALIKGAESLRKDGNNNLGVILGNRFSLEAYGLFSYALLSARNLAHALSLLCSYGHKLDHGLRFAFIDEGQSYALKLLPSELLINYPWLIEDWVFASWQIVRSLRPDIEPPLEIQLTIPKPDYTSSYSKAFKCPVSFSSVENVIRLPTRQLREVTLTRQPQVHQLLKIWWQDIDNDNSSTTAQRVYKKLFEEIDLRLPTQMDMAKALGFSLPTLKRRLTSEDKSYRRIVDEVRMLLAYEYLAMSSMLTKDAAYLLHYDNPANFCRAFRRWFNKTPEQFRQSHSHLNQQ